MKSADCLYSCEKNHQSKQVGTGVFISIVSSLLISHGGVTEEILVPEMCHLT